MAQEPKNPLGWELRLAANIRGLGLRMASIAWPRLDLRWVETEEVRRALATFRAGRKHPSEAVRTRFNELGKLEIGEALRVLPFLEPLPRPRGRPANSGRYVRTDDEILQVVEERVADGEAPAKVIDELARRTTSNNGARGAKSRLLQKWRDRQRQLHCAEK